MTESKIGKETKSTYRDRPQAAHSDPSVAALTCLPVGNGPLGVGGLWGGGAAASHGVMNRGWRWLFMPKVSCLKYT